MCSVSRLARGRKKAPREAGLSTGGPYDANWGISAAFNMRRFSPCPREDYGVANCELSVRGPAKPAVRSRWRIAPLARPDFHIIMRSMRRKPLTSMRTPQALADRLIGIGAHQRD